MLTRKALARQEETKLHLALGELKVAKEMCSALSRERDDSERELLDLLNSNKNLKLEMAQLNAELSEAVQVRDSLQIIVNGFQECSLEYVNNLNRINTLEHELQEAHNQISEMENSKYNVTASLNQSLFDELVDSAPNLVSIAPENSSMSHDTINELLPPCNEEMPRCSRNNICKKYKIFKKFVNINKYIKKTKKLVNNHRCFIKTVKSKRERLQLIDKLDFYVSMLENKTREHNVDIHDFQLKIDSLQDKLADLTIKYSNSEKLIAEYSSAINKITLDKSIQCTKQFDTNNYSPVECSQFSISQTKQSNVSLENTPFSTNSSLLTTVDVVSTLSTAKSFLSIKNEIVMFSDEIGKNMGVLLSDKGHSIVNYCSPGLSYHDIMEKIFNYKFKPSTTLLVFIGNMRSVSKKQLLKYNDKLYRLNVDKIVLFTFPYRTCLTQMENESIYNLNLTLHNTTNYCTDNKMHVIDINNFVKKKMFLTKDSSYLSKFYKKLIADSLSYYLFTSAKNLATKTAFIEQCNNISTIVNSDINSKTNLN